MSFIIILSICCSILMSFLSHFRILFGYNFLRRFSMVFWSKNDAQNRPKMTPKSTPVRPRAASGFLASSGHLWTCHFYDFWCQNGSQNDLKITQKWPSRAPNGAQDHQNFELSPKRLLWGRPGSSCHFRRTHLTSFWALLALFSQICYLCFEFFLKHVTFSEELGWGGGGEA